MTDEERATILKEGYFYHVTLRENVGSIVANGLDPLRSEPSTYWGWLKGPAVFLCTNRALYSVKAMFDNGLPKQRPRALLRVPASAIARHECDADHSATFAHGLTLLECLEQVGFIVCYGPIPPESVEVVEHQDEHGRWQAGE
jgi:hypothetical protein